MATTQQIAIYKGEFHQELITVIDVATNLPVDLTGARLSLSVWAALAATAPLMAAKTSDSDGGIVIGDQTTNTGQAVVTFEPTDTAALEAQRAFFVLWVIDAGGEPRVAIGPSPFVIQDARTPTPPPPGP